MLEKKTEAASEESSSDDGEETREDALRALGEQLSDSCLKSSTRILIVISLALNRKLGFVDLLNLTGMGKGSLSNHLEKLEAEGYVRSRSVMTFGGSRAVYEITQKGIDAYANLLKVFGKLGSNHVP